MKILISVVCFICINMGKDLTQPLMLEEKSDLLQAISNTKMGMFFYGNQNTRQYQAYEEMIPSSRKIFNGLEFYYIPSDSFKLSRQAPSLLIYRNLTRDKWVVYQGTYDPQQMQKWMKQHCFDELQQFNPETIDGLFNGNKNGFVLLNYDDSNLIRTKIRIKDICDRQELFCGKISINNPAISKVIQLMRVQEELGVSKLGYWDAQSRKLQIYTGQLDSISVDQIIGLQEGRQGIVLMAPTQTEDEGLFVDLLQL